MLMLSKYGINCSSKLEILSKLQVYESIGPQLLGALIYTLQLEMEKTVAEGEWIHEVLNKDGHFLSRYIVNAILASF